MTSHAQNWINHNPCFTRSWMDLSNEYLWTHRPAPKLITYTYLVFLSWPVPLLLLQLTSKFCTCHSYPWQRKVLSRICTPKHKICSFLNFIKILYCFMLFTGAIFPSILLLKFNHVPDWTAVDLFSQMKTMSSGKYPFPFNEHLDRLQFFRTQIVQLWIIFFSFLKAHMQVF